MVYRISLVYMFYSIPPSKKTPTPFAELRVFVFKEIPLTTFQLNVLKAGLRAILDRLMRIFWSLSYAREIKRRADFEEEIKQQEFGGRIVTEIHGFEVEDIDYDEVSEWFMSYDGVDETPAVIEFDVPFRYVRFYDEYGGIKKEYNEWDIRGMEREEDIVAREMSMRLIKFFQQEYLPVLKRIEEYARRYEEMIEALRR